MNLNYLGDALDHWKGSLLQDLQEARLLRNLAVEPMANDWELWKHQDVELYAHLLRIKPQQIILHNKPLQKRYEYFDEVSHQGDLFLDPDTGIATGHVKNRGCYLYAPDVGSLLTVAPNRILIVYQHIRAQKTSIRVDAVVRTLCDCSWCSYESGNVALIFLSHDGSRVRMIRDHFAGILGRHAEKRVRAHLR